jgi:ribonuclease HII
MRGAASMMAEFEPEIEVRLWDQGWVIGGLDEAGRGALAGPVSAGMVVLDRQPAETLRKAGVRDSKQLTPLQREHLAPMIKELARAWSVGFASAEEIDALNIVRATKLAATRAIESLLCIPDHLLTDYLILPEIEIPQTALIKGDQRCISIAAASILAKTARDALMRAYDSEFPGYGFAQHKGYGTQVHRSALARLGRCAVHRKTFSFE